MVSAVKYLSQYVLARLYVSMKLCAKVLVAKRLCYLARREKSESVKEDATMPELGVGSDVGFQNQYYSTGSWLKTR